jgi:hypothetical protein
MNFIFQLFKTTKQKLSMGQCCCKLFYKFNPKKEKRK